MKMLFTTLFDPDDLGSRCLAAYLKQFGHEVRIVSLKTYSWNTYSFFHTLEEVDKCRMLWDTGLCDTGYLKNDDIFEDEYILYSEELKTWQPDVIGIGTRTKKLEYFPELIPLMRESCPNAFIVAGGMGPTFDPELVLDYGVDAVIRGEGEYALRDLVTALEKGENWHTVKNVSYKDNNKVIKNALHPQEKNLNAFPIPVLEDDERILITGNKRYTFADPDIPWKNGAYVTLGSRGCILDCSYCGGRSILKVYENVPCYKVRQRKLKNLQEELKQVLAKGKYNFIDLHDEFFVYPVEEMTEFFTWYKNEVRLPFYANLSASQLNSHPELLDLIFEAGLYEFGVGVQSGDEEFCRRVYNRNNDNKVILNVITKFWEKGLSTFIYMIMGNPLETEENIKNTFNFCLQLPKIDPSLKRKIFFKTTIFYLPPGDILIKERFPELMHLTFSQKEFYRLAMLLECCLLLEEKEFWDLYHNEFYKENPHLLAEFYYKRLNEVHEKYLASELTKIKGKKVWIFGGGAAFQNKKHLLKNVQIEGILMDFENAPKQIDTIPVLHPEQAFSEHPEYPVIIMGKRENVNNMYKKVLQYMYIYSVGQCGGSNIITCADLPKPAERGNA